VKRRGCRVIHLASFTFQAPGFYARHGFEPFARLEDLPAGHANVFMIKRLVPVDAGAPTGATSR
jgi:hypothetical protein